MRISPTLGSVGSNRLSQYTQSVSAQTALSSPLSALRSHTHPELRSQITRPSHSPTRIPPSSTNTARHDDACTVAVAPPSAAAAEIQPSPRTTITATTLPPSLSLSLSLYSPAPLSPRSAASSPGWCGPPPLLRSACPSLTHRWPPLTMSQTERPPIHLEERSPIPHTPSASTSLAIDPQPSLTLRGGV